MSFQGQTESISISGQSVIVLSNVSDNCENHIIIQYRILAIDEMNGAVLSCVSTSNADQSRQFIELSKPFEVLEASKRVYISLLEDSKALST